MPAVFFLACEKIRSEIHSPHSMNTSSNFQVCPFVKKIIPPSFSPTYFRILIFHRPHKSKGLTKADKKAQKSDDLIKRNFRADVPNRKCVTDITELKASDGKLYVSVIFDCFDLMACGIAMDTNMKAKLCTETIDNAVGLHLQMKGTKSLKGAIIHSDRGSQYTSSDYRRKIAEYGLQ